MAENWRLSISCARATLSGKTVSTAIISTKDRKYGSRQLRVTQIQISCSGKTSQTSTQMVMRSDPLKVLFQNADKRNASIPLLYGGG